MSDVLQRILAVKREEVDIARGRLPLARVREEAPDQWDTLVQKLTVPAKA